MAPYPICPAVASTAKFPAIQKATAASATRAHWFLQKPSVSHEKETFRFISSGALFVYTESSVQTPSVEEGTGFYEAPALLPHLIPAGALGS